MVWKGIVGWIEVSVDSSVCVPGCVWGAIPESAVQTSAETVATRAGWTLTVATPVSHTLDHFSS